MGDPFQNCEGNSLLFPVVAYMFDRIDVFFQYSDIEWRYMIEDNAFNIIISAKCFLFFFYQLKRSISLDEIMCFRTGIDSIPQRDLIQLWRFAFSPSKSASQVQGTQQLAHVPWWIGETYGFYSAEYRGI